MSTHTQLSFDGFGVNDADDYRTRLATFAAHVPDARRKELGALWIAAPAMLEALKAALQAIDAMPPAYAAFPYVSSRKFEIEKALRLAEGMA